MLASMGPDFPRIPRESALFSMDCKRTSLRIVLCQGPAKASAPQTPWCVPWFVAPQGISRGMVGSQAIDFYALSCGSFRKQARNLIETAQRKSQLQSSRSPFSWGSFPSFFAFQEGMLDTQILALGGWPTVSGPYMEGRFVPLCQLYP